MITDNFNITLLCHICQRILQHKSKKKRYNSMYTTIGSSIVKSKVHERESGSSCVSACLCMRAKVTFSDFSWVWGLVGVRTVGVAAGELGRRVLRVVPALLSYE